MAISIKKELKSWLRTYSLIRRKSVSLKEQQRASRDIASRLVKLSDFKKAKVVAVYLSFGSEVLTDTLIKKAWSQNKSILIPDTHRGFRQAFFAEYLPGDRLKKTYFGAYELDGHNTPFVNKKIDLVLVPGLAFDRKGYRLGYGGGVYDRYIDQTPHARHIGLFFSFQALSQIPRCQHDHALDLVITEKQIYRY